MKEFINLQNLIKSLQMNILKIVPTLCLAVLCYGINAQINPVDSVSLNQYLAEVLSDTTTQTKNDIEVISKSTIDGIQFRWAPVNVETWNLGIKHGYTLERLDNDNNYIKVGKGNFKPWERDQWMPYQEEQYKYVHIAAMTIFGESQANGGFVEASNELATRHSFNLFAADMDKVAAEASGFSYMETDTTYFYPTQYRIFVHDPVSGISSDTTDFISAFYGVDKFLPPALSVYDGDGVIKLQWEGGGHFLGGQDLTAYYIERSADGVSFSRVIPDAFVNVTSRLRNSNEMSTYIDSVSNGITYHYRVIGVDPFSDLTEPSNVETGIGIDLTPPSIPYSFMTSINDQKHVDLSWEWSDEKKAGDLLGFNVYRSNEIKGQGQKLNETILSIDQRSFTDVAPIAGDVGFYTIEAVDKNNNVAQSSSTSIYVLDDIPPGIPTELHGEIDSNGVVLLQWEAPLDKDVKGYELFYSNHKDMDYIKINTPIFKNNFYVLELNLKTLTKNRYYKVVAVDYNYNRSDYSKMTVVTRPDIIPPVASIFKRYNVTEDGIELTWIASTSDDVASIELMRRSEGVDWEVVSDFDASKDIYLDNNIEDGRMYEYTLVTKDESQNTTYPQKTLVLEALRSYYLAKIERIDLVEKDNSLLLSWDYKNSKDYTYIVYQQDSEGDLVTVKKLKGSNKYSVKKNKDANYAFAVKVQANDGRSSKMSEIVMLR